MLIGGAAAVVAWLGLWKWTKPQEAPKEMTLADEAGGTVNLRQPPEPRSWYSVPFRPLQRSVACGRL
jgi:hypothetical protein